MKIRSRKSRQAGFSLIELVITMTIITILAGLVTLRAGNMTESARITRAVSDLKTMAKAIDVMRADTGVFPADVSPNIDPGLNDLARVPAARREFWKGPYVDRWPSENPWGGTFDYEFWNYSAFNFDGTSGNEVLISLRGGTMNRQILDEIDASMDDGNGATGMVRHNGGSWLGFYVGEGTRW